MYDQLLHTIRSVRPSSCAHVLAALALGEHHYNQLQRSTGLSSSTLANALRRLIDLQLIDRSPDGTYLLAPHLASADAPLGTRTAIAEPHTPPAERHADATPTPRHTPDANAPATPAQLAALLAETVATGRMSATELDAWLSKHIHRPLHQLNSAQARLTLNRFGIQSNPDEHTTPEPKAPASISEALTENPTSEPEAPTSISEALTSKGKAYVRTYHDVPASQKGRDERTYTAENEATDWTERHERIAAELRAIKFDNIPWLFTRYPDLDRIEQILAHVRMREQIGDPVDDPRGFLVAMARNGNANLTTTVTRRRIRSYRQQRDEDADGQTRQHSG